MITERLECQTTGFCLLPQFPQLKGQEGHTEGVLPGRVLG